MNKKLALVSDFDGTITEEDFFNVAVNMFLKPADLQPWNDYLDGRKTHFEALRDIFSKIHVSEEKLLKAIHSIHVDPAFDDVLDLCKDRAIPVYVCSAGNDYYIRRLIGSQIEKHNITLVSNHAGYSPEKGMVMTPPPKDDPFYDEAVGVNKAGVIRMLKDKGYTVLFAGDGYPDFPAAKLADYVFARYPLLRLCEEAGLVLQRFSDFRHIYDFIEEL